MEPDGPVRRCRPRRGTSAMAVRICRKGHHMTINPGFFGKPDSVTDDTSNPAHLPHFDVIHRLSSYDVLKTRVGLNGDVLSQETLQVQPKIYVPVMGSNDPIIP